MAPTSEFNFDSACTTPYASAPSSPRAFGSYYTSAPTSPNSAAAIYGLFRAGTAVLHQGTNGAAATDKNDCYHEEQGEDKSGVVDGDDFAFEFSGPLTIGSGEPATATADELFEAGKIRPLKPLPRLQVVAGNDLGGSLASSPRFPKSPTSSMSRRRKDDDCFDPFAKATEETMRGRDRTNPPASSNVRGSRRAARSLSPLRGVSGKATTAVAAVTTTVATTKSGSKKWRLKDFFLFRSASEGRVTGKRGKDPLRRYTATVAAEDARISSFRSVDSGSWSARRVSARDSGASVGGNSKRALSPHEIHYGANRAASEEMRRKTFLPYRQGLLGCLGFSPSMDGLGRAFGAVAGANRRLV